VVHSHARNGRPGYGRSWRVAPAGVVAEGPLAKTEVEVELAKLMMQKAAALHDAGDDMGASEYGLGSMIASVRVARIAPVSREMLLTFVAQFSLGLPKSC
jgi:hypothetical protein